MDELCRRVAADASVSRRSIDAGAPVLPVSTLDAFVVVLSGALAIELDRHRGARVTLEVLGPGDCLPSAESVGMMAEPVEFRALVLSSVGHVPLASFTRITRADSSLAPMVGAKLAEQHAELLVRLAALCVRAPSRRVAGALVYIASKLSMIRPLAAGLCIPLSQSLIAQVADVSRQTANTMLRRMQAHGLVRVERTLVCLLHPDAVEALARGSEFHDRLKPAETCQLAEPGKPLTCRPLQRSRLPTMTEAQ